MNRRLIIRPLAEEDLAQAQEWYDEQRPGLGGEFRIAMGSLIRRISAKPRLYPKVYRGIRRAAVKRFPYLLYYLLTDDAIIVLACLHGKRDPALLKSRIT